MVISNSLAPSARPRPDINGQDTVQTVWTEFSELKLLVEGIYRRNRSGQNEVEQSELDQLSTNFLRHLLLG